MSTDPCEELRKEAHRVGREIEQAARYLRRFAGTKPLNPWGHPMPLTEESILRLRPYDGFENFNKPVILRRHIEGLGGRILEHRGIHLFHFQFKFFNEANRYFDQFGEFLLPVMINQAIFCQKK